MKKVHITYGIIAIVGFIILFFGTRFYKVVPAGHVGVATLFGNVQPTPFPAQLHVPVNPFYDWVLYDVRQKTHKEQANVPSQDQLQTHVEVSVQYKLKAEMAAVILKETGTPENMKQVHLVPKLRSLLREQGKTIKRAEDFFQKETQEQLQVSILAGLQEYLGPKGIEVDAVLIRDISLPPFIIKAIEAKKEREQEVEKQKAELERFRTEQQQLLASAKAEREAAEETAAKLKLLADAKAYEIEKINEAIGSNPSYVKLEALKALQAISKDPAAKLYFLNGDSPSPLPLMNIGDTLK